MHAKSATPAAAPLVLVHKNTGDRIRLQRNLTLGRQSGDVNLPDDELLSGKHCSIIVHETGTYSLQDLSSKTGVTVNGIPLPSGKSCRLRAGTEIRLGSQVFVLIGEEAVKPIHLTSAYDSKRLTLMAIAAALLTAVVMSSLQWRFRREVTTTPTDTSAKHRQPASIAR